MNYSKLLLLAGAAVGVSAAFAFQASSRPQNRTVPASPKYFAIEVDGKFGGYLSSVSPMPTARTMSLSPTGPNGPYTVQMGLSMGTPIKDWIDSFVAGKAGRKNGAFVAADFNYKEVARLGFVGGVLEEVTFPALDTQSSAVGIVSAKMRFDRAQLRRAPGPELKPPNTEQKKFLISNFRISIGNLPCSKVSKVEALTIKQGSPYGMTLYFPTADAAAWQTKMTGPYSPENGRLEYLADDKVTVLASLLFKLQRVRMVQPSPNPGPNGPRSMAMIALSDLSFQTN